MSLKLIINRQRIVMASCAFIFVIAFITLYCIFGNVSPNAINSNIRSKHLHSTSSSPSSSSSIYQNPNKELQLVHAIFRHGIRTPADTYPNDPHVNELFYPVGWGQITNGGKKRLFALGKWLRKRYNSFLGSFYQPDLVYAQATGVSRTHMSLAVVLAGLWPPKNTPMEWDRDLNWQPIPIYSEPLQNDTLLLVRISCPRYYEALSEVFQLPEIQNVLKDNELMFEELTDITGMNITTPDDAQSLYSTLLAEEQYGLVLPSWTTEYYPKRMKNIVELSYIYNVYTNELKKIKGGPFLKKMINDWTLKQKDLLQPKERKVFLYAGHDSTVVNILSALNLWEKQTPVYGIMAIFELYKDINTGEYGIQAYLKNETNREPYPLTIPGCDFHCPLDKVLTLTKNVIPPNDFQALCKAKNPYFTEPPIGGP